MGDNHPARQAILLLPNAFTDTPFTGNPAGVVPVAYATDEIKQIDFGGLRMERFDPLTDFDWCGYPLDVQLIDRVKTLSGLFIYNQEIFKEATIRTMTEEFKKILAAVVERPELTISELVDGIG